MSRRKRRRKCSRPINKDIKVSPYKIYLPKGYLKFPDGIKIELYSVGVIADVIVKDWRDIRDWEFRGLIPLTPFCDAFGRRLYTKDMIRIFVQCAEEYQVPVRNGRCHERFDKRAFFINLSIRLERLFRKYLARLEMNIPDNLRQHNNKFIRSIVLQSATYKEYLREKELRKIESRKKYHKARSERFWKRWREDEKFRETTYQFFLRKERYYERIGLHERAEKLRQGRRKYYDENGNCIVDCQTGV